MDQVRGVLGVRFRLKLVTPGQHLVLDGLKVFDNAVVNDGNPSARQVRMRVRFGHAAMCRPARVRHAYLAAKRVILKLLVELGDFAHRAT